MDDGCEGTVQLNALSFNPVIFFKSFDLHKKEIKNNAKHKVDLLMAIGFKRLSIKLNKFTRYSNFFR